MSCSIAAGKARFLRMLSQIKWIFSDQAGIGELGEGGEVRGGHNACLDSAGSLWRHRWEDIRTGGYKVFLLKSVDQ
jgi:hypothetical protein